MSTTRQSIPHFASHVAIICAFLSASINNARAEWPTSPAGPAPTTSTSQWSTDTSDIVIAKVVVEMLYHTGTLITKNRSPHFHQLPEKGARSIRYPRVPGTSPRASWKVLRKHSMLDPKDLLMHPKPRRPRAAAMKQSTSTWTMTAAKDAGANSVGFDLLSTSNIGLRRSPGVSFSRLQARDRNLKVLFSLALARGLTRLTVSSGTMRSHTMSDPLCCGCIESH